VGVGTFVLEVGDCAARISPVHEKVTKSPTSRELITAVKAEAGASASDAQVNNMGPSGDVTFGQELGLSVYKYAIELVRFLSYLFTQCDKLSRCLCIGVLRVCIC